MLLSKYNSKGKCFFNWS